MGVKGKGEEVVNKKDGFTLLEVIVVVAIIALLAAILAPQIAKYVTDAKVSKARADVNTIAAAIGDFYKDTGRWPTANNERGTNGTAKTNPGVFVLGSREGTNARGHSGSTTQWIDWFGDPSPNYVQGDTFRNQFVINEPGGNGHRGYPVKEGAERGLSLNDILGWNGPYIKTVPADPWGHRYYCNVVSLYYGTGAYIYDQCWVISAGPNGIIETPVGSALGNPQSGEINSDPIGEQGTGDDIGVMIK